MPEWNESWAFLDRLPGQKPVKIWDMLESKKQIKVIFTAIKSIKA
jgi:hypothetical protein